MATNSIHDHFQAALDYLLQKGGRGEQARIAKETGIQASYISEIRKGDRIGPEEKRRAISKSFGYEYEGMLEVGRRVLAGEKPEDAPKIPATQNGSPQPAPVEEIGALLSRAKEILSANSIQAQALAAHINAAHAAVKDSIKIHRLEKPASAPASITDTVIDFIRNNSDAENMILMGRVPGLAEKIADHMDKHNITFDEVEPEQDQKRA